HLQGQHQVHVQAGRRTQVATSIHPALIHDGSGTAQAVPFCFAIGLASGLDRREPLSSCDRLLWASLPGWHAKSELAVCAWMVYCRPSRSLPQRQELIDSTK